MAKTCNVVNEQHAIDDIWNVWVDYEYLPERAETSTSPEEPEGVEIMAVRFESEGLDIRDYLDEIILENLADTIIYSIIEQGEPS